MDFAVPFARFQLKSINHFVCNVRAHRLSPALRLQKSSFWSKNKEKDAAPAPPVEDPGRIAELNALVTEQKASLGAQAKEVEQLKLQLAMTTKLFEQGARALQSFSMTLQHVFISSQGFSGCV